LRDRVLSALTLAVISVALPSVGEQRFLVAGLLVFVISPAMVVIERLSPARQADELLVLFDVIGIVALTQLVPGQWVAALIVLATSTASAAASLRVRSFTVLWSAGAVAMAVTALVHGVTGWLVPTVVLMAAMGPVGGYARWRSQTDHESGLRLESLVRSANAIFWEADPRTGKLLTVTGRVPELTGYRPHIWKKLYPDQVVHPEDLPTFGALLADRDVLVRTARIRHADGSWVWIKDLVREVEGPSGETMFRGVSFDVTELQDARAALIRYLDIVDRLQAAVVVIDVVPAGGDVASAGGGESTLRIVEANPAAERVLGEQPRSLIGKQVVDALPWVERAGVLAHIDTPGPVDLDRFEIDEHQVVDLQLFPLPHGHVALMVEDVTAEARSEDRIRYQAEHDELTGLVNRAVLMAELERALEDRRNPSRRVGVLTLDLDRFKEVNDTLGHAYGDDLLRSIAGRLPDAVRAGDLVARLGGDEFAVLLRDDVDLDGVVATAERIAKTCSEPIVLHDVPVSVGVSIGITLSPDHGSAADDLVRRADIAMYAAKRGGESYRLFDRTPEPAVRRLALSAELPKAIGDDEFELWFQPKYELATERLVGCEALVRWSHPTRGLIMPDDFLELVALSSNQYRFDLCILDQAIRLAAHFNRLDPTLTMAANLSPRSLLQPDLPDQIAAKLAVHGLMAGQLTVEITEREIVDDLSVAEPVLRGLRALGVDLSVDDFGTGSSSLTRLRDLPVSEIKIDRSFVSALIDDGRDAVIVQSIIEMARGLGHRTVAEGVETVEVADRLRQLNCDQAQGFLLGRPMQAAAFTELILGPSVAGSDSNLRETVEVVPANR